MIVPYKSWAKSITRWFESWYLSQFWVWGYTVWRLSRIINTKTWFQPAFRWESTWIQYSSSSIAQLVSTEIQSCLKAGTLLEEIVHLRIFISFMGPKLFDDLIALSDSWRHQLIELCMLLCHYTMSVVWSILVQVLTVIECLSVNVLVFSYVL